MLKLGIAFSVEPRENGRTLIETKADCLAVLKKLLRSLEVELCGQLGKFNKESLLPLALRNIEAAKIERHHWLRTGRANMAINSDQPEKQQQIVDRNLRANNAILPCRLLTEFGVASCAEEGGRVPGELDLSQLMAKAYLIFQFGGWFNAIWWEWMPPRLLITPLGDIHAEIDYDIDVVQPYAKMISLDRVQATANGYEQNYETSQPVETDSIEIEPEFEKAFECEFGYSINDIRSFVVGIEDFGQETGNLVFTATRNELIDKLDPSVSKDKCPAIIDELLLPTREGYRALQGGLCKEDFDTLEIRAKDVSESKANCRFKLR